MKCKKSFPALLALCCALLSCSDTDTEIPSQVTAPVHLVQAFNLRAAENPDVLDADIIGEISDTAIVLYSPTLLPHTHLVPEIRLAAGTDLQLNGLSYEFASPVDFSEPLMLRVTAPDGSWQTLPVLFSQFTGLPVVYLNTEKHVPITSKTQYSSATISVHTGGNTSPAAWNMEEKPLQARGRGYSTWMAPKKPYKLKFGKKTGLLDMPAAKTWALLANYLDRTKLRTSTAFYLGRLSNLEWMPGGRFVELFVNGEHQGNYFLCELIKEGDNRLNIGKDAYVLEVDQATRLDADDVFSQTRRCLFNIKEPAVLYGSDGYEWIRNQVNLCEDVLYGAFFLDPQKGYRKYIDLDSFVDWYLINEITRNNDAVFWSSCYMHVAPGGKLKMGPLWDFDLAFGNYEANNSYIPEGFWVRRAPWISRMWEDSVFVAAVRRRFDYFKECLPLVYRHIDREAELIRASVGADEKVWHTMNRSFGVTYYIWGNFDAEVSFVKRFLSERMQWLDENIPTSVSF